MAESKLMEAAETASDVAKATGQGMMQGLLIMALPIVFTGVLVGLTLRVMKTTSSVIGGAA
jgi:hypothetical protein